MPQNDLDRFLADVLEQPDLSARMDAQMSGLAQAALIVTFANRNGYDFDLPQLEAVLAEKRNRLDLAQRKKEMSSFAPDEQRMIDQRWSAYGNPKPNGICDAPWKTIRIDALDRTTLCCGFFEKLPAFDWPSAQEFHAEGRMWNHPILQHMRSGMGRERELPFCSYCQGRYPGGATRTEARKLATCESRRVFDSLIEEAAGLKSHPEIEALPEDLTLYCFKSAATEKEHRPFRRSRREYRNEVRRKGYWKAGRVLVLGARVRDYAPFLAEAGNEITLADAMPRQLRTTTELLSMLSVPYRSATHCRDNDLSGLPDNAFDSAWIDGHALRDAGYVNLLGQLRKKMRKGGRLRVKNAFGIGALVSKVVQSGADELQRFRADEAAFLGLSTLPDALRSAGYVFDRQRSVESRLIGGVYRNGVSRLGNDAREIFSRLAAVEYRAEISADPHLMNGLESTLSFCVTSTNA